MALFVVGPRSIGDAVSLILISDASTVGEFLESGQHASRRGDVHAIHCAAAIAKRRFFRRPQELSVYNRRSSSFAPPPKSHY
jgi:hypothetical protein